MDANYSGHEMKLLQDKQLTSKLSQVGDPDEESVVTLIPTQCSVPRGGTKATYSKCFLTKICVKCIAVTLAVCAFLFLAHSINKIKDEMEVGAEKISENTNHASSQSQALKGSDLDVAMLADRPYSDQGYVDNADFKHADSRSSDELTETKAISNNYRKHFIGIGMRHDNMMQDCLDSQMKHSFPDIDYAFLGYDIFRGYPLADGHDPGFTLQIFDADYSHGKQTADCRYSVPKGFLVVPDVSCVTSFSSEVIQTAYELTEGLSSNAQVSGGGFGVAFSASAGFRQASSDLSSKESVYIVSTAHCNYYISKFLRENPPPFTKIFLEWIYKLNSSSNNDVYFDFFDTFGTHFSEEVTFGARFTYEHKMKSSEYKSRREKGFNVAAQASYSGLFSVSGGFSLTSEQREEASKFSKAVETRTVSVGAAPPANGDAMTWASVVQNNPVPSKYKLESVEELFRKEYMENLGVDYETMSSNIQNLKMKYYERLIAKKRGKDIESMSNRWITKMLTVDNGGKHGTWGVPQFCPVGTFAAGFSVMLKSITGTNGESRLLNDIGLKCANKLGKYVPDRITQSGESHRNSLRATVTSPSGNPALFLQNFALKIQKDKTGNTSVNAIRFSCRDLDRTRHSHISSPGSTGHIVSWSEECPVESAVCGVQIRIAGDPIKGDNTVLNNVRLFCCGDDSAYLGGNVIF